MRCLLTAAAGLLTVATAAAQPKGEMVPNPAYANWSAFKPGTTAALRRVVKNMMPDDPAFIDVTAHPTGEQVETIIYELIEVNTERAVVRRTIREVEHGNIVEHAPVKVTYPAKVAERFAEMSTKKDKVEGFKATEETVKVAGKEFKCEVFESVIKTAGETSEAKMWTCDKVPGGILKEVVTKKQGDKTLFETTYALTAVKIVE